MTTPFKMITETDIEKYRADSFYDKEPETVEWIRSFKEGDIFYDIGANIGVYSLYAASLYPGIEVYSFEPMPSNYWRLIQNVYENGYQNIRCFNIALSDRTSLGNLFIPDMSAGKSGAQIKSPEDEQGNIFLPDFVHAMQFYSLEDFIRIFKAPTPTHIKIDVDGHELEILTGADWVITDEKVKSVLVECNPEKINIYKLKEAMRRRGFTTDNSFNQLPNHSRVRRAREGITAENIVFLREG